MHKQSTRDPQEMIDFIKKLRKHISENKKSLSPIRHDPTERTAKKAFRMEAMDRTTERKSRDDRIERKIDTLASEISKLATRQDQLEEQHRVLFLSLKQIQDEKVRQQDKRSQLIRKLDQMLEIQQRQEENLNQFKTLFGNRKPLFAN